jgi:uncharacterized repeat protein (TIGR03803 family)
MFMHSSTRHALTFAVLSALLLIAARPAPAQIEKVLYSFGAQATDGFSPESSLTSHDGGLYGTTYEGFAGPGIVFELMPKDGWNETVLYSFCTTGRECCPDGANPTGFVIFDRAGNLYGTTYGGGAFGRGVVFELSPVGTNWVEKVLYSFGVWAEGVNPVGGLIMDRAGNLYGATFRGGGGVFELSPSAGGWTEQVIYAVHNYDPDGGYPGLSMAAAGNIFGTSRRTVFELSPNSSGGWTPTVIHKFIGGATDGTAPRGAPVLDASGNLYGTTRQGGAMNYGTVYEVSPSQSGWTETILYSFEGHEEDDGAYPYDGVVLDASGNIYGTTYAGGEYSNEGGVVFELVAQAAEGNYQEKVLWSFNEADGLAPYGKVILDKAGHLYGTTYSGGILGFLGVVFEVTP